MFSSISPAQVAVIGLVVLVVLLAAIIISRYQGGRPQPGVHRHRPQGQAVPRRDRRGPPTCPARRSSWAAGVFVVPVVQKLHILDLSSRRIPVRSAARSPSRASSATSRASRSSRSAATRTRSGPPPSGSWTSRTRSTPSPRRCWPVRCARSSAALTSRRSSATGRRSLSGWPTRPRPR